MEYYNKDNVKGAIPGGVAGLTGAASGLAGGFAGAGLFDAIAPDQMSHNGRLTGMILSSLAGGGLGGTLGSYLGGRYDGGKLHDSAKQEAMRVLATRLTPQELNEASQSLDKTVPKGSSKSSVGLRAGGLGALATLPLGTMLGPLAGGYGGNYLGKQKIHDRFNTATIDLMNQYGAKPVEPEKRGSSNDYTDKVDSYAKTNRALDYEEGIAQRRRTPYQAHGARRAFLTSLLGGAGGLAVGGGLGSLTGDPGATALGAMLLGTGGQLGGAYLAGRTTGGQAFENAKREVTTPFTNILRRYPSSDTAEVNQKFHSAMDDEAQRKAKHTAGLHALVGNLILGPAGAAIGARMGSRKAYDDTATNSENIGREALSGHRKQGFVNRALATGLNEKQANDLANKFNGFLTNTLGMQQPGIDALKQTAIPGLIGAGVGGLGGALMAPEGKKTQYGLGGALAGGALGAGYGAYGAGNQAHSQGHNQGFDHGANWERFMAMADQVK